MKFIDLLGKERLFFDGAMGTMLQKNGLSAGEIPETWNITHRDTVYAIHKAYADAGCNIIKHLRCKRAEIQGYRLHGGGNCYFRDRYS